MKQSEARRRAEQELEELTDQIRWGIQAVMKEKLDQLREEGEGRDLLLIRASKNALGRELWIARFAKFFDGGYRAYVNHLTRLPEP